MANHREKTAFCDYIIGGALLILLGVLLPLFLTLGATVKVDDAVRAANSAAVKIDSKIQSQLNDFNVSQNKKMFETDIRLAKVIFRVNEISAKIPGIQPLELN